MSIELQGSLEGVIDEMLEGSIAGNIKLLGTKPTINELNVTTNGTYEAPEGVDGYSPIVVAVPERVPVIEELNVNTNGTYNTPSDVDGYDPIVVNVPVPNLTTLEVAENGIYIPSPNVAYNRVEVDVPSGGAPLFNAFNAPQLQSSMTITMKVGAIDVSWNGTQSNFMAQLSSDINFNSYTKAKFTFDTGDCFHDSASTADNLKIWLGSAPASYSYLVNSPQSTSIYNTDAHISLDKSNHHYEVEIPLGHTNDYLLLSFFGWNISNLVITVE